MDKKERDLRMMAKALEAASESLETGDIPVGAVITDAEGNIIASACNRREADGSAVAHAEILCIEKACKAVGGWRLSGCTMYVTLEPCPMCAGAVVNSRISRVVIGARNPKAGALGSVLDLNSYPLNHSCKVECGVMGRECSRLLTGFFRGSGNIEN